MNFDLIELNLAAETNQDVIVTLGKKMLANGYVKDSYINAVIEREMNLPTGLNLGSFSVAIPHTNAEHVILSHIAVAVLKKPVIFYSMIDHSDKLQVELVFLLAIKDPDGQVSLLQKLMSVFQNLELLQQIKAAKTKEEVAKLLDVIEL
ncbi:PTS system galactitol-specific IIA component [Sporomusaceae bacterium BoRhaA]|uniref:PTS sugar transporter subunit IIA n=1 Tax=Pelorhabdus rhamnosifermentans TaxID=2772457 RepID=UPI001C061A13|nr:PTS sugar transporter subunit IIA [Pelorhabdus rhamnosifermentans]MBU2700182.1 PTS system galactitol-specific IIA component [Pelorhabdus rhamnosifermentans]